MYQCVSEGYLHYDLEFEPLGDMLYLMHGLKFKIGNAVAVPGGIKISDVVFKGDIRIGSSFYGANFNKITAYGSFSCGEEEVSSGIYGSVKQFVFDKEAFRNCQSESMVISMYSLGIKELVIPSSVYFIGKDAFEGWASNQKIILDWPSTEYKKLEGLKGIEAKVYYNDGKRYKYKK